MASFSETIPFMTFAKSVNVLEAWAAASKVHKCSEENWQAIVILHFCLLIERKTEKKGRNSIGGPPKSLKAVTTLLKLGLTYSLVSIDLLLYSKWSWNKPTPLPPSLPVYFMIIPRCALSSYCCYPCFESITIRYSFPLHYVSQKEVTWVTFLQFFHLESIQTITST